MIDFLKRIDWLFVAIVIGLAACIIMVLCTIADAADNQYLKFQNFAGGLTTNQVGEVPNNACLQLENFLFDNQELRVRKGYGLAAAGFNLSPVHWLGMYRRQGAAGKLFVQAGNQLYIVDRGNVDTVWTDNEYTQNFFETGTVNSGANGSMYVRTADSTSRFESYSFTSVDFDSGTTTKRYSVDFAVSDSLLKLKTATTGVTGWTYKFSVPLGDVVYGQTFVDTFYLATSTGALRYNDSTLSGTVTPVVVRGVPQRISKHADFDQGMNHYTMQFDSLTLDNGTWLQALYDNKQWVRVSLRSVGASSSVLSGEIYYMTLPIYLIGTYNYPTYGYIRTGGGAFLYNTASRPKVSLVNTEIDPNSKLTIYADSVILRATSTGTYDTRTIIVDDSLMVGKDSSFFASGDWFICKGTEIVDDFDSKYSAVVGNYFDDSSRIYVTDAFTNQYDSDTIGVNVPVTFFRRRIALDASTGVNAAIFWNDRYHVVYSDTPSEIEHSAQFFPSDFSDGYLTQVSPDDGEPILWLKEMYGALLIGKRSSIWRLTGIGGVDAFARLDKVVEGVSFVAPRSIVQRSGLMFGLGRDGFYMFDFNSMVKISDQINDLVRDSINWDYASNITAAYFDGHFWVSYPSRASIVNNRTLCYDPQNKAWASSTLDFDGIYVDGGVDDTDNVYIGSPDTGKVFIYGNATTDAGASITATLATSWFDMGSSFLDKIVNRAAITNHRSASCSVSVSFVAKREDGYATTSSRVFSGTQDTFRGKTRLWMDTNNLRGVEYQLNLTATNAIGLRLGNVEVEYQILSAGY